jgi:hypothetical protein
MGKASLLVVIDCASLIGILDADQCLRRGDEVMQAGAIEKRMTVVDFDGSNANGYLLPDEVPLRRHSNKRLCVPENSNHLSNSRTARAAWSMARWA